MTNTPLFTYRPARPAPAPRTGPAPVSPGGRALPARQSRYKLIADLDACRLYVVECATGQPVARYLMSPGKDVATERGGHFRIERTELRNNNGVASVGGHRPLAPGPRAAAGLFKMVLGSSTLVLHGSPACEHATLGRPGTQGSLRLSNENVLQLFQRYAGVGTEVVINRNPAVTGALRAAFRTARLQDHAPTDGGVLLPGAMAGRTPTPLS